MRGRLAALILATFACSAGAHSASDAYLTLDASGGVVRVQWDIALRDLDFVMKLDDDGDGRITWRELRRHQDAIARYAYVHIAFARAGRRCDVKPTDQLVDNHADGAYAALFFDVVCAKSTDALTLDYRLFFRIDPSHRAILVSRDGTDNGDRAAVAEQREHHVEAHAALISPRARIFRQPRSNDAMIGHGPFELALHARARY